MPWIVGIDEAGYGPNLGPFVMTAVASRVKGANPAGREAEPAPAEGRPLRAEEGPAPKARQVA